MQNKLVFVGDIASPNEKHSENLYNKLRKYDSIFNSGNRLICNLEGLISSEDHTKTSTPVLFNHQSVLSPLKAAGLKAVGLANNHTLDLPQKFNITKELLEKNEIAFCGAGTSVDEADKPATFSYAGKEIFILNACWDFLLYHQKNPTAGIYVSEIDEKRLLERVFELNKRKNNVVIVFLHWSFDLETLPFPMYRQLAKALIDNGARMVVGSHSHCVQGGEKYKDGYIAYGLGNFYLPNNIFVNGNLKFPDFSRIQLALEYDINTEQMICHWLKYENNDIKHELKLISSEKFEHSSLLKEFSPFIGMSDSDYKNYYKNNRRKKVFIPIYSDYRNWRINRLKTLLLKNRARFARILAKFKFIDWQN